MKIGSKEFDLENKIYIMGILNVTPDSFSDGGQWNHMDRALKHVEDMVNEGASIIDIGGESTKPGYTRISDDEEVERVVPFIESINSRIDVPISIDTYKAAVAKEAVKAGAHMINDIWGFKSDKNMAKVAAEFDIPCCIMHNRDREKEPYTNLILDVISDLKYDGRHSYEDNIVPVEEAYEKLKGRIAIMGGIDVNFLASKTPEEIYKRSIAMLERTSGHGGYALGSGNSIASYIPFENYQAMRRAAIDFN